MKKIRVLLADDSGLMRLLVADMLAEAPDILLLDTAADGHEAFQKTKNLRPDVLVLDMLMPQYDGKYAIEQIMFHCPTPIILLSALGNEKPLLIEEALQMGALDYVNKPNGLLVPAASSVKENLLTKIRQAVGMNAQTYRQKYLIKTYFQQKSNYQILILGASTGGAQALESVLAKLPANFPLIVIVAQHLPKGRHAHHFAQSLQNHCQMPVLIAEKLDKAQGGNIYLLKPEYELDFFINEHQEIFFELGKSKIQSLSIDQSMKAVARSFAEKSIAVLLSGMGKDGSQGMKAVYWAGGLTIAQDQKSSLIYGMPAAAIENRAVQKVLPIQEIPNFLLETI